MGRPKKYATAKEAANAKRLANRQSYAKLKLQKPLPQPRYVAYMPLPSGVPPITAPGLQLRTDCIEAPALNATTQSGVDELIQLNNDDVPLPLPLALYPSTVCQRTEEGHVQQEQQAQQERERIANTDASTQQYNDLITAQLNERDSASSSLQLLSEAAICISHKVSSSGSGSGSQQGNTDPTDLESLVLPLQPVDDIECNSQSASPLPLRTTIEAELDEESDTPSQQEHQDTPLLLLSSDLDYQDRNSVTPLPPLSPLLADPAHRPDHLPAPLPLPVVDDSDTESLPLDVLESLAEHLWEFKGCSDSDHTALQQTHTEHHRQPHIHPDCHSLSNITALLQGTFDPAATPLPDVLQNPKVMARTAPPPTDFSSVFEGRVQSFNASLPSPPPPPSPSSDVSDLPSLSELLVEYAARETPSRVAPDTTATPTAPIQDSQQPRSLCLDTHHCTSHSDKRPEISFDIDSVCCFPTSLAVAKGGIKMYATAQAALNLKASVHFALPTTQLDPTTSQGVALASIPIHLLPHYCFGRLVNMEDMLLYISFPNLRPYNPENDNTIMSTEDQELWFDNVLFPSLNTAVVSANKKQYYPASKRVADQDATAAASEGFAKKFSAREQILYHTVQQGDLQLLWSLICNRIEEAVAVDAPEARFKNPVLFCSLKNSKLRYMKSGSASDVAQLLPQVYSTWRRDWMAFMDERFYSKDDTFIDLGKQITSPDSALPFDQRQPSDEAEVYLWRACCLKKYLATRRPSRHRHRHRRRCRSPTRPTSNTSAEDPDTTYYPFATFSQAGGLTIASKYGSGAYRAGLIYSQFYSLIKVPFDAAKVYIFNSEALENLALDPSYVRTLQHEGRARTFSAKVCQISYLHSKRRAYTNLQDNQWRSYGIREEHRLSMSAIEIVIQQWRQRQRQRQQSSSPDSLSDLYEASDDERHAQSLENAATAVDTNSAALMPLPLPLPLLPKLLPYYVFTSHDMFAFLRAQINRYCFLFEQLYSWTGETHSLPEFIMMILALRALRFSYGSGILTAEPLLYNNEWQNRRGQALKGIGMKQTMAEYGFGWFLPKVNWSTFRLWPQDQDGFLAGNTLLHIEYQRRWQAVQDLGNVYLRLHQAQGWFDTFQVQESRFRQAIWLEYLTALNINQFRADVTQHVLDSNKKHPELTTTSTATATAQLYSMAYCFQGMRKMFRTSDGDVGPPHTILGNRVACRTTWDLVQLLFGWDEVPTRARGPWEKKTYRFILQQTHAMITAQLGSNDAKEWYEQFLYTIMLTHWVLPYATATAFLPLSKTNKNKELKGHTLWYSTVLNEPSFLAPSSWTSSLPRSLGSITATVLRRNEQSPDPVLGWRVKQLLAVYEEQGILFNKDYIKFFQLGSEQDGTTLIPRWEVGKPLPLQVCLEIASKSLSELDEYVAQNFGLV